MAEVEGPAAGWVTAGVVATGALLYLCWRVNNRGDDDDNGVPTPPRNHRSLGTGSYNAPVIVPRAPFELSPDDDNDDGDGDEREALLSTTPQTKSADDANHGDRSTSAKQKKAAAAVLYRKLAEIPVSDEATIQEIFETVDANQDGLLSRPEVEKAIVKRQRQLDLSPTVVLRAFEQADANKDGYIDREEFFCFCRCITYFQNLLSIFEKMDTDGNRRLSREEFVQAAHVLNVEPSHSQQVFDEMDENHGGYIVFEEFCLWMAQKRAMEDVGKQAGGIKVAAEEESEANTRTSTARSLDFGAVTTTAMYPSESELKAQRGAEENLAAEKAEKERLTAKSEANRDAAEAQAKRIEEERIAAEIARQEEERVAAEKAAGAKQEAARLAKLEEERGEAQRLAKLEAEGLAKLEEERIAKKGGQRKAPEEAERIARLEKEPKEIQDAEKPAKLENEKVEKEGGVRDLTAGPNPIVSMPKTIANLPSRQRALALFDKLDVDSSQTLSFSELGKSWKELFQNLDHKPSVMKAYRAADENKDGFVVRSEFEAFLRYITYHNNCHDVFSINGHHVNVLGRENFKKIAKNLWVNDPDKVFDLMDANDSNGVSYEEYCSFMARNTCQWNV